MLSQEDWESLKGSGKPFPSFMLLLTTRASFPLSGTAVGTMALNPCAGRRQVLFRALGGEEIKGPGRAGLGIRSQHKCMREPRPDSDVSFPRPVPPPTLVRNDQVSSG